MYVSAQNVMYDYSINGENDTAYVKSATVMITNPYLGNYTISVPVDTLVKVKR